MFDPAVADLIGKPFDWGARGPDKFDCYGLLMEVYRRAGRYAPDFASPEVQAQVARAALEQRSMWTRVECRPGAVALIEAKRMVDGKVQTSLSHVGVILPYGRMIHCDRRLGGVVIEDDISMWGRRIEGFYEFPQ